MNNEYLSKSKYCRALQCNKILWLDKYKQEEKEQTANESVLENGTRVGRLAKGLFGPYQDIEYSVNKSEMIEKNNSIYGKQAKCNYRSFIFI